MKKKIVMRAQKSIQMVESMGMKMGEENKQNQAFKSTIMKLNNIYGNSNF